MKTYKKCEDHCPECNRLTIVWESRREFGEKAECQPGVCTYCGCEFLEIYRAIKYGYSETEYDAKNF